MGNLKLFKSNPNNFNKANLKISYVQNNWRTPLAVSPIALLENYIRKQVSSSAILFTENSKDEISYNLWSRLDGINSNNNSFYFRWCSAWRPFVYSLYNQFGGVGFEHRDVYQIMSNDLELPPSVVVVYKCTVHPPVGVADSAGGWAVIAQVTVITRDVTLDRIHTSSQRSQWRSHSLLGNIISVKSSSSPSQFLI